METAETNLEAHEWHRSSGLCTGCCSLVVCTSGEIFKSPQGVLHMSVHLGGPGKVSRVTRWESQGSLVDEPGKLLKSHSSDLDKIQLR